MSCILILLKSEELSGEFCMHTQILCGPDQLLFVSFSIINVNFA